MLYNDLREHLNKKQISLIVGPRQVGKSTIMKQLHQELTGSSQPSFFITLEDKNIRQAFDEQPEHLFQYIPPFNSEKKHFLFIDEIQYLKDPSNFLKYHYDKYSDNLKFIVSGSSNFYIDKKFTDSLAGRKRIFKMPTLSFAELLLFREREELLPFINSGNLPGIYKNEVDKIMYEYLTFGGYPDVVIEKNHNEKIAVINELATSYIKKDIDDSNIRSPELYYRLLQLLAENSGSLLNINTLSIALMKSNQTIEGYLNAMIKSFHICVIRPFFTNLTKELRKMPKAYFTDPGLRNYFVKNFKAIATREDKGKCFENFVFRKFYDKYDEMDIQFWLTQKKHEVDFVIKRDIAFEVKFTPSQFNPSHYKYFTENYPEIKLHPIHHDNVNEISL